jgi:hypothetical protein
MALNRCCFVAPQPDGKKSAGPHASAQAGEQNGKIN